VALFALNPGGEDPLPVEPGRRFEASGDERVYWLDATYPYRDRPTYRVFIDPTETAGSWPARILEVRHAEETRWDMHVGKAAWRIHPMNAPRTVSCSAFTAARMLPVGSQFGRRRETVVDVLGVIEALGASDVAGLSQQVQSGPSQSRPQPDRDLGIAHSIGTAVTRAIMKAIEASDPSAGWYDEVRQPYIRNPDWSALNSVAMVVALGPGDDDAPRNPPAQDHSAVWHWLLARQSLHAGPTVIR